MLTAAQRAEDMGGRDRREKEEDLSALRAQAICSLLVMAREAPSMWPSSRITLSQCTCTP